jgi:biotin synthesis protein BioG
MKHKLIAGQSATEIIIFFNGWGMDARPVQHLAAEVTMDVLLLFDYTILKLPINLEELCRRYQRVHLLAWSLGVWAAAIVLENSSIKFDSAIAINGTVSPVSSQYGIPPEIFHATLNTWDELSRKKFNRRMCAKPEILKFFDTNLPERSPEEQRIELQAIANMIAAQKQTPNAAIFKLALSGNDDRIFPLAAQVAAWQKAGVPVAQHAMPHYPFTLFNRWQEWLNFAKY